MSIQIHDVPVLQLEVVGADIDAELLLVGVDAHGHRGEEGLGERDVLVAGRELHLDHRVREVLREVSDHPGEPAVESGSEEATLSACV